MFRWHLPAGFSVQAGIERENASSQMDLLNPWGQAQGLFHLDPSSDADCLALGDSSSPADLTSLVNPGMGPDYTTSHSALSLGCHLPTIVLPASLTLCTL